MLVAAVAARAESPGIDAYFLRDLRDSCPNAQHVTAYAAMVQAAAFRRDLAEHQPANELLAAALRRQATIFAPLTADDTEPANGTNVATASQREALEDQILADLLRHPEQAHDLATFLDSDTFTSQQRKELYETIVMLAEAGDAIDEIIVAWEHTRLHAYQRLVGADDGPPAPEPPEPDDVYLARLATTPITIPSAVEAARDLLAEDIRTTLSGNGNGRGVARPTTTPDDRASTAARAAQRHHAPDQAMTGDAEAHVVSHEQMRDAQQARPSGTAVEADHRHRPVPRPLVDRLRRRLDPRRRSGSRHEA